MNRPHFIVNARPSGRRAASKMAVLRARVNQAFPEGRWRLTSRAGEAAAMARGAAEDGADIVVAVGGDGTIHEVVNGLMSAPGARPALGIVPAGSGSDFARTLGLPHDPVAALGVLRHGGTRRIDVGEIECAPLVASEGSRPVIRYFVNMAGCGASGRVVERFARWRLAGAAGYGVAAALTALDYRWPTVEVAFDKSPARHVRLNLLFVCNGEYCGGGMRVAEGASPDDGELLVVEAGGVGRLRAVLQWPELYFGGLHRVRGVRVNRAREVVVTGPGDVLVDADGELLGRLPVAYRIVPDALDVCVPTSWIAGCASRSQAGASG